MYTWLPEALGNSGTVVTANRRLARALADQFAADQIAAGKHAWRSPSITAWQDWLVSLCAVALRQEDLPTRINAQQSQLLWERCLQKESYDGPGLAALVRLCRESRQRLADWQVSIRDLARESRSEDHRVFASVLGRYLGILERENWVDDAGLGALVLNLLANKRIDISGRCTFAGFDRVSPVQAAVHDAIRSAGREATILPVPAIKPPDLIQSFDTTASELRAAGAWARRIIQGNANARIAIVANNLDQDADLIARHVREGATPGWQHGHRSLVEAINISYGRRFSDYPAIAVALMLLRWLVDEISSGDVGLLLRTPLIGGEETSGRSKLELHLRELPDRRWTPSMVTAELRGQCDSDTASDWLAKLAAFSKARRDLAKSATPADWAVQFDQILKSQLWPGIAALDSAEYQLLNRWRELLNDFARLGLVHPGMTARVAVTRLEVMAGEIIFQPETVDASIQLLGPLEASGLQFDGTWISSVTTANWPPAGAPSTLVSRRLQEERGMPDCSPADTLQYAQLRLNRLLASGQQVICSFPLRDDDADQTLSDLLPRASARIASDALDTGLYAARLLDNAVLEPTDDRIPAVMAGEKISGGAGTVQRQIDDPIAAFIHGRMGANTLSPQALGIPPPIRGKLVHDALYSLYCDLPTSDTIRVWQGDDLGGRIENAVNHAFARHEKNADAVLQQLFKLERTRIADLLRQFVALDGNRGAFKVAAVEGQLEYVAGNIRLPLRFDRIDAFDDGEISILDYKTGAAKQLLSKAGDVREIQLFVYALAADATVAALALVNVDSREISFDGAGRGYGKAEEWPELLQRVTAQIAAVRRDVERRRAHK